MARGECVEVANFGETSKKRKKKNFVVLKWKGHHTSHNRIIVFVLMTNNARLNRVPCIT